MACVAGSSLRERQGEVEDLAGVDLPVPDELDELGQVAAHRGRPTERVDAGEEQLDAGDLHVVVDADVAEVSAAAGRTDGLHERLAGADGLDDGVGAQAPGQLLDLGDPGLAALLDDVGGAVEARELLPLRVARHGDDPIGAELLGREDRHQPDGSVPDDRDGLARAGLRGVGGEPAGAEHVRRGEQRRDEVLVGLSGGRHERAVGVRDAGPLRLGADAAVDELGVHALGLEAGPADLARVVGDDERPHDEVADLDGAHLGADLLDDTDVLVPHEGVVDRLDAAVGPQVAAADARRRQADDRVGRLDDPRVLALLHPHVAGSVHDYSTHRVNSFDSLLAGRRPPGPTAHHTSEAADQRPRKSLSRDVLTGHLSRLGEHPDAA